MTAHLSVKGIHIHADFHVWYFFLNAVEPKSPQKTETANKPESEEKATSSRKKCKSPSGKKNRRGAQAPLGMNYEQA